MITHRQENLLDFIIKEFIDTAKPIGSSFVSKQGDFDLSPATIRNDMADLENAGFLAQLHTSGGRVPTDKAYRYFVNNIIHDFDLDLEESHKRRITSAIYEAGDSPREINKAVARVLSNLSDNLVITGISEENDFYKIGLASLFEMPEFKEFDKVFRLTSFFDGFEEIFNRIESEFFGEASEWGIDFSDFNVFIGKESKLRDIKDETIMCAKYNLPGHLVGSLTLVGPTRMDYEKNISLIKYTTDRLNKLTQNY